MNSYFSHDSNARNSEELIKVRMKYKAAGYGVYFMLLERLRDSNNYMSIRDYNLIAFDLREDASLIKSIIEDFGLFAFTEDGKCFYSEGLRKRMNLKDETKGKRSEAGKKGMAARWGKNSSKENCNKTITNDIELDNKTITNDIELDNNKSKVNKRKEISTDVDIKKSSPPSTSQYSGSISSEIEEMKNSQLWIEQMQMRYHIKSSTDLIRWLDEFKLDCECRSTIHRDISDAKKHFCDWLRIQIEKSKSNGNSKNNFTSKQEANDYAMRQFAEECERLDSGISDGIPKPF